MPQGGRATARRVRPREPRRGFGEAAGALVQRPGGHSGVGPLLERQRLLERAEGLVLTEHHLQRFAEQHPRVGMVGEPHGGLTRRLDGPPAVIERTRQMDERGIGIGETGCELAAEPQPSQGAVRGVALGGRSPACAEAAQRGAK